MTDKWHNDPWRHAPAGMPWYRTTSEVETLPGTTGPQYGTAPPGKTIFEDVFHEIGRVPEDSTLSVTVPIDVSSPPNQVIVRSHVVATGAVMRSPQYLATVRRRKASQIAQTILSLKAHRGDPDFTIWTHKPLEVLRQLLQTLTDAEEFVNPEHEGNSCEVLRLLRDTFLDGGWEKYRDTEICDRVAQLLKRLAEADEVTGDFANDAIDELLDIGLSPAVGMAWDDGEDA
jgi:hypothetical protein